MSDQDALRAAFRDAPLKGKATRSAPVDKRALRAARTRAEALSPVRILVKLLLVPVVTVSLTLSIYIRTSPYEKTDAMRHLAAMAGCDTAMSLGLAPAYKGTLGYHARNDPDGDGIACAMEGRQFAAHMPPVPDYMVQDVIGPAPAPSIGAKFVKP